jgi:ADP-ribosylation factor-like protein 1
VVDASDHQRLPTARAELLAMLSEEELRGCKLLVFANKQDLPNALDEGKVGAAIGLNEIRDRQWSIWRCSAKTGAGLNEGLDWCAYTYQACRYNSIIQVAVYNITMP